MSVQIGRHPADLSAPEQMKGSHEEVAAKRVEHELVDLGAHFGDAQGSLAWLHGALPDSPCSDLLERIEQREAENQADLTRLMCEAKKVVRGE
jgi:hypothetical protein